VIKIEKKQMKLIETLETITLKQADILVKMKRYMDHISRIAQKLENSSLSKGGDEDGYRTSQNYRYLDSSS